MKKYITGIFAVVLAVGASAFTHIQSKPAGDPMLYWVAADGTDDGLKTATQETIDRNCTGGTFVCSRGYNNPQHTGSPVQTLRKPNQ
ncbi:MAG: hypothetical protein INR73_08055 [Williamsia sp.]|nr:hypothetical protein [Williamsia sp.]